MARPGDRVQDKISGAKGIVVARTEWIYGCVRLSVQPEDVKDGKPADCFVVDEPQATVLTNQALKDSSQEQAPAARSHGERNDALATSR